MKIGVPKEIKAEENRVGLTPASVLELVRHGHQVSVESDAAISIGLTNADYEAAGAAIAQTADHIFADADMIVKVKEPQPKELAMLRADQILFTYLHLAPDSKMTDRLVESGCSAIGYETVTDNLGGLPLLAPMSEVAGRMAIQAGAHCLEMAQGGCGTLLSGVPGVQPGKIVVIGGGVVGSNALALGVGIRAHICVLDTNLNRLAELDSQYRGQVTTLYSTRNAIEREVAGADLVIGAVLVPGAAAPKLVSREMVGKMRNGSVLVDVAIDQGGCFETSRPTTHAKPTYVEQGVVHYCVANIPGAVARTSTFALNNATLPYVLRLADHGLRQTLSEDEHFRNGLNIHKGQVTCRAVAEAQSRDHFPADQALAA
jgi:alanine dehydrogenase